MIVGILLSAAMPAYGIIDRTPLPKNLDANCEKTQKKVRYAHTHRHRVTRDGQVRTIRHYHRHGHVVCKNNDGKWVTLKHIHKHRPSNAPKANYRPNNSAPLVTKATGHQLGIQYHGLWSNMTDSRRAAVLNKIKASGAKWVRLDMSWAMIQPNRGSYDMGWGVPKVDTVVREANQRGLKILATFWLTPSWANGGRGERTAPSNPQDYADALAWAAKRWDGKIQAWEVWNEPNSGDFLNGANPVQYSNLLCAAYRKMKNSGVKQRVVYGGTMYNDSDWIKQTYQAGAINCYDIMATHPYTAPADDSPGQKSDGTQWSFRHVQAVRNLEKRYGKSRPMWLTEYGWSAHRNDGSEANWEKGVTEAQQAEYATQVLDLMKTDYPYIKKAFYYEATQDNSSSTHLNGYGMLTYNLQERPVYKAFQRYLGVN